MTNYNRKSFNVSMGKANISEENWERTFGKKGTDCPVFYSGTGAGDPGRMCSLRGGHNGPCDFRYPAVPALRTKEAVPVSGVWLRTRDETEPDVPRGTNPMKWTIFEVLVEIDGKWRCIQTHRTAFIEQTISHITENAGMRKAPEDHL